jgi:hypothetical protein
MIQDNKGKVEDVVISSRCYDEVGQRQAANYRKIITVNRALGLKFLVFRERDAHKFVDPEGHFVVCGGKVETTIRMRLKGGLHIMFHQANPATICSIHFDGHEHCGLYVSRSMDSSATRKRLFDAIATMRFFRKRGGKQGALYEYRARGIVRACLEEGRSVGLF